MKITVINNHESKKFFCLLKKSEVCNNPLKKRNSYLQYKQVKRPGNSVNSVKIIQSGDKEFSFRDLRQEKLDWNLNG